MFLSLCLSPSQLILALLISVIGIYMTLHSINIYWVSKVLNTYMQARMLDEKPQVAHQQKWMKVYTYFFSIINKGHEGQSLFKQFQQYKFMLFRYSNLHIHSEVCMCRNSKLAAEIFLASRLIKLSQYFSIKKHYQLQPQ